MRWLAVVAAVLLLVLGALFGVGYFFLPVQSEVSRKVVIDRPAASVHALVDNLRTFNEWSPWYAADPRAEYVISGDAGVGQRADWRSKVASVGRGSHRIVRSEAPRAVESIVEFAERGSANMLWTITPMSEGGVEVRWTMRSTCTESPLRVPCRYVSLITRGAIEQDLALGLEKLKIIAEQLPDADFAGLSPEFVRAVPMRFAYVENDVRREPAAPDEDANESVARDARYAQRVATAISESLTAVEQALAAASTPIAGPPVLVTLASSKNQISFQVGYPYEGAGQAEDPRVSTGQTPGGKALKVVHAGPNQTLSSTYRLIDAYLRAHRLQAAGGPWEVYAQRNGAPESMRTEIYVPLY